MSTELNSRQRSKLRGMAMNLKPAIQVGKQGMADSVIREMSLALNRDELIKVRVTAEDREARSALMEQLATATGATLCGATGNSAVYFRESEKKLINLNKLS